MNDPRPPIEGLSPSTAHPNTPRGPGSGRDPRVPQRPWDAGEVVGADSGPVAGLKENSQLSSTGRTSIFGEILDWMAAPLLLLWPMSVVFTFFMARGIADQPFDRLLEQKAEAIAQRIEAQGVPVKLSEGGPSSPERRDPGSASVPILDVSAFEQAPELAGSGGPPIYRLQIRNVDGAILAGDPDLPKHPAADGLQRLRVSIRTGNYHGEELRIAALVLQQPGTPQHRAVVQLAESTELRENFANDIIRGLIVPQFLVLPIAVALVWVGLSRGLKPLKSLEERMKLRSPDDLSPLPLQASPEEIAPLLRSFNALMGRLEQLLQAQRRFIANAAHQMKTPLAGIRTQAELALRTDDPREVRASLEWLARSSDRAAHVLNQLLALARTESFGPSRSGVEEIVLAQRLRAWAQVWADRALAQGQDFGLEIASICEEARVRVHPTLIAEMLNNLVDNALRYTPTGSVVTIVLRKEGECMILEVEDDGPGIAPSEQALVFERFYRILGSEPSGSGLGLAIVREIAHREGLRLRLQSPAHTTPGGSQGGCRFSVLFPRIEQSAEDPAPKPDPIQSE